MDYLSTFTGVMGFDMGLPPDWHCVGVSEINKYANMVLRYRLPGVENYGDIEKINYRNLPDFGALIGGSPCQDISMAGKREGLAGVHSRLFHSYVAILKVKQPDYFIWENVKGALSSNGGRDFATILNEFSLAGYNVWWQVIDATWVGIPQHRERVFVFGALGDRPPRQIFLKPKDRGENSQLRLESANTLTARYRQQSEAGSHIVEGEQPTQVANTIRGRYFNGTVGSYTIEGESAKGIQNLHFSRKQVNRIYGVEGVAPTLHRYTGGQQITKIVASRGREKEGKWVQTLEGRDDDASNTLTKVRKDNMVSTEGSIRYLTPLESERLMGWPDNWTKYGINEKGEEVTISDTQRYNLVGNGVVPQVVREVVRLQQDVWKEEEEIEVPNGY